MFAGFGFVLLAAGPLLGSWPVLHLGKGLLLLLRLTVSRQEQAARLLLTRNRAGTAEKEIGRRAHHIGARSQLILSLLQGRVAFAHKLQHGLSISTPLADEVGRLV